MQTMVQSLPTMIELMVQTMVQFNSYHDRVDGADNGTVISYHDRVDGADNGTVIAYHDKTWWCRLWYSSIAIMIELMVQTMVQSRAIMIELMVQTMVQSRAIMIELMMQTMVQSLAIMIELMVQTMVQFNSYISFVLFDLILMSQSNKFSVMSGLVFLG